MNNDGDEADDCGDVLGTVPVALHTEVLPPSMVLGRGTAILLVL